MATKKECDRCAKQWDAGNSDETCAVAIDAPQWGSAPRFLDYEAKKKIGKTYELCQDCARAVVNLLEAKGDVVKST